MLGCLVGQVERLGKVIERVDKDEWDEVFGGKASLGGTLLADARNHVDGDAAGDTESGGLVETGKVVDGPFDDFGWVSFTELTVDGFEISDDVADLSLLFGLF